MSYKKFISEYIQDLKLMDGTRYRGDCPVCNRHNTFSVFEVDGKHVWKCFHADCDVKGSNRKRLSNKTPTIIGSFLDNSLNMNNDLFILPDTFVDISRSERCSNYLKSVNSFDAYLHRRIRVMYDVKLNRAVFLILNDSKVVDAVGRSLSDVKPKWYRYGKSRQLFTAGSFDNALLVEDCASASCVSNLITGIAMLGTSLLKEHIEQLRIYNTVYVALDKDATKLGLKTVRMLKPHINVRMLILEDDIKNMETSKRDEYIRSKTCGTTDTGVYSSTRVLQ